MVEVKIKEAKEKGGEKRAGAKSGAVNYAEIALFATGDLRRAINICKRKADLFTEFSYNTVANPESTLITVGKIEKLRTRIERLSVMESAILLAVSKLSELEKKVVYLNYFKKLPSSLILEKLNITIRNFKAIKSRAVGRVRFFIFMLGITEERFYEYYDEEPVFIKATEDLLTSIGRGGRERESTNFSREGALKWATKK
ncbi:MAG: hypothetical protein FWD49_06650 [Firmicutes bacterium]|nr:hypothetical protein [Bacillota bacterium]